MPRGDGTGPMGTGSMTGRKMGYCNGYVPRGGIGFGCKRGFYPYERSFYNAGYMSNAMPNVADRKEILKREAEDLEYRLEQIKKELSDTDK